MLQHGFTALYWAAGNGHLEALRVLLEAGANVTPQTKVRSLLQNETPPESDPCGPRFRGRLILIVVSSLTRRNHHPVSLSQNGATPLHFASSYGHAPVVALLLATPGVDPLTLCVSDVALLGTLSTLQSILSVCPQAGMSPLSLAQKTRRSSQRAAVIALLEADPRVAAAQAITRAAEASLNLSWSIFK